MKRIALLIVCMFLVSLAANDASAKHGRHHEHHRHHKVAVGGSPVIDCQELMDIFSYPGTQITEVTLAPEGSIVIDGIGPMPEHCIVKGKMNERVSAVDGKTYAIGFEMRLPTERYRF